MKVLLISDFGVPRGGSEVVTLALRRALRARGYDARLFAGRAEAGGGDSAADYHCFGTTSALRAALWPINPAAVLTLRRVLAEFQPDVVHVRLFLSQLSPAILPLLRDVPAILHEGWYRTVCPVGSKVLPDGKPCRQRAGAVCYRSGCVPLLAWPLAMAQLRLWRRWRDVFDVVVANSQSVAEQLKSLDLPSVEVVRNGIPARASRPPLAEPPTIVFAGRLAPEKGGDTLLEAFKVVLRDLPQARLLIAGDGPDRLQLQQIAEPLGPSVSFLGHLPRAGVEERFNAAWVQAVPSRGAEAFGNAAAEAMMRGTAVVASAVDGLAEYVQQEKTGLLVAPDDPDALGAALLRLVGDRAFAEALGEDGRRFAQKEFDQERFVDRFVAIYDRLTVRA